MEPRVIKSTLHAHMVKGLIMPTQEEANHMTARLYVEVDPPTISREEGRKAFRDRSRRS